MKKSAILDIFNGERGYVETMRRVKCDQENIQADNKIYGKLQEKLSPELMELHNKYIETIEKYWGDEVDFYFVEGFKLGLLIGIECMEETHS